MSCSGVPHSTPIHSGSRIAGHRTQGGCGLLALSRRSQPQPMARAGGCQAASGAAGREVRSLRPGRDRARRHNRTALGREDRRPGKLPGSGALEPQPFRRGERPALAIGHAAGTGALGTASLGAAVPNHADAVRAHVCVLTRLRLDARLFVQAPPDRSGTRGRPRRTGERLSTLRSPVAAAIDVADPIERSPPPASPRSGVKTTSQFGEAAQGVVGPAY